MRQVPNFLIIGNGRVARHFHRYFSLINLPFMVWNRQHPIDDLQAASKKASHILLLINDSAIEEFITKHLSTVSAIVVHFSGSLVTDLAYGAHPLMSFNSELYTLAQYYAIPFILDHTAPPFVTLLPGLTNQHAYLHTSLKAKYHAVCVLSGNFSCMLWQKLFSNFQNEFNLPPQIAQPFLIQQMHNLLHNPETALTGPLVRGDKKTIASNLQALSADPFLGVYKSFMHAYARLNEEM